MTRLWRVALTCMALAWTMTWTIVAQEPVDEFRPVMPGELGHESIPAAPLVFAAYAFVWVVFVVYVSLLWRRMKSVEADLKDVSGKLGVRRP